MKKGKTSKMSGFRNSKITYGTVDSKNFKSLYLNLQTWVEPKIDVENWSRLVLNMNRSIKHSIFNHIDKQMFDDKFIVDMDLEINLYLIDKVDFKDLKLKRKLKDIIKGIYNDVLHKNDNFKFYLTKNGNVKPIKVKTEKV
jgi:hypothetical protein